MIINRNSWHYKLIHKFGRGSPEFWYSNSCDYNKAVIGALSVMIAAAIMAGLLTVLIANTLAWYAAMIIHGMILSPTEESLVGSAITTMVGVLFGCFYLSEKHLEYKRTHMFDEKEPGYIKQAYRNFKDKICTKLEFVDDQE